MGLMADAHSSPPKSSINGGGANEGVALRLDLMEARLSEYFEAAGERFDALECSLARLSQSLTLLALGQFATVAAVAAALFWH